MSFSFMRTAAWFFSASLVVACGAEFSAGGNVDAGSGGSSGSANLGSGGSTSGASGDGGASGSRAGRGGTNSGGGGVGGTAGVSGQAGVGGDGGASGQGGVGGTGGGSGRGGVGGTGGGSGRGGVGGTGGGSGRGGAGGSSGAAGRGGSAGNPGDAGPDASCQQDAKCSDNSCSRLLWTFDSGALDGLQSVTGHTLAVRTIDGSAALAVDVVQLNQGEISFSLPICLTGTLDLSSKTLSFRVNFAGGPPSTGEVYVGALLSSTSTGYISDIYPATGGWVTYSDMLSKATQSSSARAITIRLGSTGAPFSGTVWFDDFRIQ